MPEYINREALMEGIGETVLFSVRGGTKTPTPEMRGANKVIDRIKSAPVADVVEVVRCKDCLYCKPTAVDGINACIRKSEYIKPADYCSHGELKKRSDTE